MCIVNGSCYLVHALLGGDGAQGGSRMDVVEVESQEAAAAELIHQKGLALLKHIWVRETQTGGSWNCDIITVRQEGRKVKARICRRSASKQDKPSLGDPQFIR